MTKQNTIRIADYKEYQTIIKHVTTYNGTKTLKTGDVIDSKDTKMVTLINGKEGKKLRPTSTLKEGATVYEYVTAKDKLAGTITKYATKDDIVDTDVMKQYKQLMNDITTKLINGDLSPEDATKAIEDLKQAASNS